MNLAIILTGFHFNSRGSTTLFAGEGALDPWCISPEFSAARALSTIAALRALSLTEGRSVLRSNSDFSDYLVSGLADSCNTVVTFYATSLAQVVGSLFQAPSLSYLARHWFESSSQLRADSLS